MSFGFSIGDFLAVGGLCWKVYKKCKESPGNYAELSREVGALHNVLKETEELLSQQDLTPAQKERLAKCRQGCDAVLKDLNALLLKYESLGTKSQRTFDRMGYGTHDMDAIRLRLISNVSMLDAFNNACSHARLEMKLNLLITEVRAGRREGSIVSVQTIDTVARNNRETWEVLRRELEDVGISPGVISEKRQFIIAWFQEAVAAGKLEEDTPSDDDESLVLMQVFNNDDSDSNSASVSSKEASIREVPVSKPASITGPSSTAAIGSVNETETGHLVTPTVKRDSSSPGDVDSLSKAMGPRLRISSLIGMLQGKDKEAKKTISKSKSFMKAVEAGKVTEASRCLAVGIDIDVVIKGWTALTKAVENNDMAMAHMLILKGADVNLEVNERSPIFRAARKDLSEMTQFLLEQGAKIQTSGGNAFFRAAYCGFEDTMNVMLKHGVNVESRDDDGSTALHNAARFGLVGIMRMLLANGADIDSKDVMGRTAMMKESKIEVLRLLVDEGADIEGTHPFDCTTKLITVAGWGNTEMAKLLLDKGADVKAQDWEGYTALIWAAEKGHEETVRLLLENGANVSTKTKSGQTALVLAEGQGHKSISKMLRDAGA